MKGETRQKGRGRVSTEWLVSYHNANPALDWMSDDLEAANIKESRRKDEIKGEVMTP